MVSTQLVHRVRGDAALRRLPPAVAPLGASCVILRNPFDHLDRELHLVDGPVSVGELARRHHVDPSVAPVVCRCAGKWLLQKDWDVSAVAEGSCVEFIYIARGGSILRTALQLSLVAAAIFAGPAAAAFGGLLAQAAVTAAILGGGNYLINAVIPLAPPGSDLGAVTDTPSPTYSLSAQGNTARLGGPIPVLYGRHIIYPDYATTPWQQYELNIQFLHSSMIISQGYISVEAIRIGDADITGFAEVTTEVVEPGDYIHGFHTGIFQSKEVTGSEMLATDDDNYGDGWVGPFPANPPGTTCTQISLDLAFDRGLISFDSGGAPGSADVGWEGQFRRIDDRGVALDADYSYFTFETESNSTMQPFRFTNYYTLTGTAARFEIRLRRNSGLLTYRAQDVMTWVGLKATLPDSTGWGTVTALGTRMQASESLSSRTAQLINVIATRKLPIWNGSTWSAVTATSSIAWAAADILRNTTYGLGLADSRIDLAALLALDAIWTARGDTCNVVFDRPISGWEALTQVLRCGRARPYHQGGMVRFYRDHAQTLPVTMFSQANIKLDTFQLEVAVPVAGETADGVEGNYFDEDVWRPISVTAGVGADPDDPATIDLIGITNLAQAQREADYQAAANRYRRAFISFDTELEGMIPSEGDLVLLAHDVPSWGTSGHVAEWDATTRLMHLAAPVNLDAAYTWTIRFRDQEGAVSASVQVTAGVIETHVILAALPTYPDASPFTIVTDLDREPTHFVIGRSSRDARLAIVTAVTPRGDSTVGITAVLEDDRVHVN